jgi:DNA replication protein DnaC
MLATAPLGVCACQQGRRVRFTTLAALANELQEARGNRELARVVGRYARAELVVLDELAIWPFLTARQSWCSRPSRDATNAHR